MINQAISHDYQEETIEAKARWFQALPLTERMELLCLFTDLILTVNSHIVEQKDAQPLAGRVRVLTPRAAGREQDLEDARLLELDNGETQREV
jgi:hypothetical protein